MNNPFNEKRAPAMFKLFKALMETPDEMDVFAIHEKVRGPVRTWEPREVQMALSPTISRANKKLEEHGLRIVLGKADYTYVLTEFQI